MRLKKIALSFLIVAGLVVAAIFSVHYFYNTQAEKIAKKTENYLIDKENKKKEDMKEIKGIRSKGGDYGILVRVIYKNNPNVHYFYKSYKGKITYDGKEDLSKAKEPGLKGRQG
ncbi:DUF3139 domain-containing protein [Bacillus glycinifermentans]|nr:DUF3139 domain-containing protein [Bacillus glycinifermentans]